MPRHTEEHQRQREDIESSQRKNRPPTKEQRQLEWQKSTQQQEPEDNGVRHTRH